VGRVILIGGEMPQYADQPAGGPALATLLSALPQGRTLIAGCPDEALLTIPDLTVLVRGLADAERLTASGVRVLCGSLPKLDPAETFDLVVVPGGVERTISAEGPQLDWAHAATRLASAVRPDGILVLVEENLLGLHQLTAPAPWYADRRNEAWTPVGPFDRTRPGSLSAFAQVMGDLGRPAVATRAAFGDPRRPGVLVPPDATEPGWAAAAAAVMPADARRFTRDAIRAGQAAAFAPAWVAVGSTRVLTIPAEDVPPDDGQDELLELCLRRDIPGLAAALTQHSDAELAEFARTLVDGGYNHPWSQLASAEEVAAILTGLVGRTTHITVNHSARPSARELHAEIERLHAEVAHEKALRAWNQKMLGSREGDLRRAEAKLDLLSGTFSARVGKLSARLVRHARRWARRVLK